MSINMIGVHKRGIRPTILGASLDIRHRFADKERSTKSLARKESKPDRTGSEGKNFRIMRLGRSLFVYSGFLGQVVIKLSQMSVCAALVVVTVAVVSPVVNGNCDNGANNGKSAGEVGKVIESNCFPSLNRIITQNCTYDAIT